MSHTGIVQLINKDENGKIQSFQINTLDIEEIQADFVIANVKYVVDTSRLFESAEIGSSISFSLNPNRQNFVKEIFKLQAEKNEISDNANTNSDIKSEYLNLLNKYRKPFISIEKYFNVKSENPKSETEDYKVTSQAFGQNGRLGLPDLLECVLGIGTIAVDVQYRSVKQWTVEEVPVITISKSDYKKALQFHREFCLPWWWVVKLKTSENKPDLIRKGFRKLSLFDFDRWYEEIIEKERKGVKTGFLHQNDNQSFIAIPLTKWSEISD
jgi:hypothetical protein